MLEKILNLVTALEEEDELEEEDQKGEEIGDEGSWNEITFFGLECYQQIGII